MRASVIVAVVFRASRKKGALGATPKGTPNETPSSLLKLSADAACGKCGKPTGATGTISTKVLFVAGNVSAVTSAVSVSFVTLQNSGKTSGIL